MATDRHTHNFRKCSHTSVGLAQARPNNYTVNNGYTLTNIWCMLVGSWEREKSPQAADHTSSCSALTTEKSGSGDVSWRRREVGRRKRGKRKGEFTRRRRWSMYMYTTCFHLPRYINTTCLWLPTQIKSFVLCAHIWEMVWAYLNFLCCVLFLYQYPTLI